MVDHVQGPALLEGHRERDEDELGPQVHRHRPADDAPAPRVEDCGFRSIVITAIGPS
jgi:hypothetical protein